MKLLGLYFALSAVAFSNAYGRIPLEEMDDSARNAPLVSSDQYVETARERGLALIPIRHKAQLISPRLLMSAGDVTSVSLSSPQDNASIENITGEILAAEDGTHAIPSENSAAVLIIAQNF
jgi:hypothetical protein